VCARLVSSSPSIRLVLGVPESIIVERASGPSLDASSSSSSTRARTSLVPDVVLLDVVLDGIDIVTTIVVFDAAPIAIAIAIASPSRASARGGRWGEGRWRDGFHGSGLKMSVLCPTEGGVARHESIEGVREGSEGWGARTGDRTGRPLSDRRVTTGRWEDGRMATDRPRAISRDGRKGATE